jgi:hypothetical protein
MYNVNFNTSFYRLLFHICKSIFYQRIWCVFLLFIDVFLLFILVLNQLHPISIYIVYICLISSVSYDEWRIKTVFIIYS